MVSSCLEDGEDGWAESDTSAYDLDCLVGEGGVVGGLGESSSFESRASSEDRRSEMAASTTFEGSLGSGDGRGGSCTWLVG